MTDRSVAHDTFSIERSYPATPSRVFAAFASAQAKDAWGATSGLEHPESKSRIEKLDLRAAPARR